jgi:hypothetical protein
LLPVAAAVAAVAAVERVVLFIILVIPLFLHQPMLIQLVQGVVVANIVPGAAWPGVEATQHLTLLLLQAGVVGLVLVALVVTVVPVVVVVLDTTAPGVLELKAIPVEELATVMMRGLELVEVIGAVEAEVQMPPVLPVKLYLILLAQAVTVSILQTLICTALTQAMQNQTLMVLDQVKVISVGVDQVVEGQLRL